jgi:hypothetical protein
MALKTISLQLDAVLLARIDQVRGDVPRQRWVGRVLTEALTGGVGPHFSAGGFVAVAPAEVLEPDAPRAAAWVGDAIRGAGRELGFTGDRVSSPQGQPDALSAAPVEDPPKTPKSARKAARPKSTGDAGDLPKIAPRHWVK